MKLLMKGTLALLVSATGLIGQQSPDATQADLIKTLLGRIEQLERRVSELEGSKGTPVATAVPAPAVPTPPTPAPPPAETGPAPTPMDQMHSHDTASPTGTFPNLHIAGFSDFNFSASDRPGTRSGFNEGQFILHLNSALSQKVSFLAELSMTARTDAGTGTPPATGFNVEVERSIIRFEQNDYFKVSFGRYHTPINYWNTEFHHGSWLQTTVARPEMVQFGGSFIPVHFVGALVEGAIPAGGLNLNYNVGIGNGRGSVISRSGDFGDINNNKAWLVTLFARPDHPYGLQVGGSIYNDKITPTAGRETREWIESGHFVWTKENPEIIAEFANVVHRAVGDTHSVQSQAWYTQFGYRLPWGQKLWKPYYRFEYIHIPGSDAIFRAIPSLAGSVVGTRYDISSFAALKFEYRNQRRPGVARYNSLFVQTSFTF